MNDILANIVNAFSTPPRGIIGGFVDGCFNADSVESGVGWMFDARGYIAPTRSNTDDYAHEDFDSLTGWALGNSGTASAAIVNPNYPDPAIGNAVRLATGAALSSTALVQRDFGSIPASYGLYIMPNLGGTTAEDALIVQVQNSQQKNLQLRLYASRFEVFQDGAWRLLIAHGGAYWTEWWAEVEDQGNGTHKVSLYAGTEYIGSRTGVLPSGPVNNDGLVVIQQNSGASANRTSQVAALYIGRTQLPDGMRVVFRNKAVAAGNTATVLLLVEDVCNWLIPGTDVVASVSSDDGGSWQTVSLAKSGVFSKGGIDSTKDIEILCGQISYTANQIKLAIECTNGKFVAVKGAGVRVE